MQEGNQDKATILKKDIDLLSKKLGGKLETENSTKVTISILGIGITIPTNLSSVKDWFIVRRKPHLRFLQSLYDETIGIATISDSIRKIFDIKFPNFDESIWSQYKTIKMGGLSLHSQNNKT